MIKFKVARGLILRYMDWRKFDGWTSFWNTVYLRESQFYNEPLRTHELTHVAQINRLGRLRFSVMYIYYNFKYGYWKNPFEVEAYAAQDNARRKYEQGSE